MRTEGGFCISKIKQVQDRIFYKMLEDAGIEISSGQGRILYVLWQEGPMSIGEIGRRTSLAKTTLTAMLDRMEDKGIVARTFNKTDRRQTTVSLTPAAERMRDTYRKVSDDITEVFYRGFTESEITDFENKLRRILDNLTEEEGNEK
ncbi:MAG: MarR family winged helix-turn-helix transcriptional regulator [Candidatus Methanoplasma sp.]|jgi:DNA-binding MarR family transcriptional regulator|nr:MarR family winged helix-turn-helix transcriptional regulator [Candidatus Methanoplasma sp.]